MACQQVDHASTDRKLDEIDKRLANIETQLQRGGGAAAPVRPERPPGPDAATVYAVPIAGAPFKGAEHAKVTIVEAFEFA